jgi:DNA uptake protein ComE-like DNA-binding protein
MTSALSSNRTKWIWVVVPLASLGIAAFVSPLYFALRHGRRSGYFWSVLLLAAIVAFYIVKPPEHQGVRHGIAEALIMICWVGGAAVAGGFVITTPDRDAVALAREQRKLRQSARQLISRDPALAVQAHIGRPDLSGASHDGGLVDVNRASEKALAALPGVDVALAKRIVSTRHAIGGFASVDDLVNTLNLNPTDLDDAAELLAFIPL